MTNFNKRNKFITFKNIFIAGVLLRLALMFADFSWDVNNHISWAQDAYHFGLSGFYETQSKEVYGTLLPNYPPLAIYLFYPWYQIQQWLSQTFWNLNISFSIFPSQLVTFVEWRGFIAGLLKIPAIFADLGIAWLVFKFSKIIVPNKIKIQIFAVIGIIFNPSFFYNSALMGQIDAIPIFFTLASIYILKYKNNAILGTILFILGVLVKPTSLVFFPIILFILFKEYSPKKVVSSLLMGLSLFWISFLPFFKSGNLFLYPFETYKTKILDAQSLGNVSNLAFNFWAVNIKLLSVSDTAVFFWGMTYRNVGYFIVGLILLCLIYLMQRMKDKDCGIYMFAGTIAFTTFIFLTKMHERYFLLPLAFFLLVAVKEPKFIKYWVFISIASFINIYSNWTVPRFDTIQYILNTDLSRSLFSLLNVILYFYIILWFVKKSSPILFFRHKKV